MYKNIPTCISLFTLFAARFILYYLYYVCSGNKYLVLFFFILYEETTLFILVIFFSKSSKWQEVSDKEESKEININKSDCIC